MRPAFCICQNKDADQLHGNHAADQRLCFLYIDSTLLSLYFLNSKFQASRHLLWLHRLVRVRPGWNPDDRLNIFTGCGSFRKSGKN